MQIGYHLDVRDYNKIVTHADKSIRETKEQIKVYKMLIHKLKKYDGKALNKRVEAYGEIEGYSIHHAKRYDWHYLYISNKETSFRCEITLAEHKGEKISIDHLTKSLETLEKDLLKFIEAEKRITETINIYNTALDYYKKAEDALKNIPGWYTCNRW